MNTPSNVLTLGPDALFIAPRCAAPTLPPPERLSRIESAHYWRTREEKMRLLDPCPELTLATERMEAAERLFRASLCLFGGCFGCLVITSILAALTLF